MDKVKTKIIKIDLRKPLNNIVRKVAREMKRGKIAVYPTETCYGLGTNALNEKSVEKIYKIKKEPTRSNILVIVHNLESVKKFGIIDKKAKTLIKTFMPGPLTMVVKKKKQFPNITNKDFVFRISGSKLALKLAKEANSPLTATSANIHGKPSIYSGKEIIRLFEGKVDIILDGGKLKKIKPSTIVDMKNKKPKLIRKGPIPFKKILDTLNAT